MKGILPRIVFLGSYNAESLEIEIIFLVIKHFL